jgi:hypothetical protein
MQFPYQSRWTNSNWSNAFQPIWHFFALISAQALATFELYGQRFGGIEPHFKDYKSAAFDLVRSHLRGAAALGCLLMLLAAATLIAIAIAVVAVIEQGRRTALDWHSQRGLSFLQLGLREIERSGYLNLPIPQLATLPCKSPPAATASLKKRAQWETRIEFSRVTAFSS